MDDQRADQYPESVDPSPTRELGDHGRLIWGQMLSSLPPGILGPKDSESLTQLCEAAQRYHDFQMEYLAGNISLIESVNKFDALTARYFKLCGDMGMTPTTRGKILVNELPPESDNPERAYFGLTG
jgi:hypothetical protein